MYRVLKPGGYIELAEVRQESKNCLFSRNNKFYGCTKTKA